MKEISICHSFLKKNKKISQTEPDIENLDKKN